MGDETLKIDALSNPLFNPSVWCRSVHEAIAGLSGTILLAGGLCTHRGAMHAAIGVSAANVAAIKALESGSLGVGLSGGGFVIYYLVGALDALIRLGILVPGQSKIAGASAGALCTTAICSGLNGQALGQRALDLANWCRVPGNCGGVLDAEVRKLMDKTVVRDGYRKCNNTGFISISVGEIFSQKNMLLGTYTSDQDLKNAAAASAYVPLFSGPEATTTFRGLTVADGGLTDNLPCPPGVSYCLRLGVTPYGHVELDTGGTLDNLLAAQADNGTLRFDPDLPQIPAVPTYNESRIAAAAAASKMDLQPGVYSPFPFTRDQWSQMKFRPASERTLEYLRRLGFQDAMAWAKRNGMAKAAAAKAQVAERAGRQARAAAGRKKKPGQR